MINGLCKQVNELHYDPCYMYVSVITHPVTMFDISTGLKASSSSKAAQIGSSSLSRLRDELSGTISKVRCILYSSTSDDNNENEDVMSRSGVECTPSLNGGSTTTLDESMILK